MAGRAPQESLVEIRRSLQSIMRRLDTPQSGDAIRLRETNVKDAAQNNGGVAYYGTSHRLGDQNIYTITLPEATGHGGEFIAFGLIPGAKELYVKGKIGNNSEITLAMTNKWDHVIFIASEKGYWYPLSLRATPGFPE